jgi:hypothetical protein
VTRSRRFGRIPKSSTHEHRSQPWHRARGAVVFGAAVFATACGGRTPVGAETGAGGGFGRSKDMGGTSGGVGSAGRGGATGGTNGSDGAGGAESAGRGGATGGINGSDGAAGRDVNDTTLPDGCRPLTCTPLDGRYCGLIGDGCSGSVDCGQCPSGQVCGLRTPNVCGTPCGLCADIPQCDGTKTTVSGTAVTGARTRPDPLYKALVYIPNLAPGTRLPPLIDGPICNRCVPLTPDTSVTSAITGPDGRFTLENVPAGKGIPLVVQLDRWRYQTTIDVLPCTNNVLPEGTARLPRNQNEGDIPLTAISTGRVDALECVLRGMGIDDSEFTSRTGSGRIHLYRENGAGFEYMFTPPESELTGETGGAGAWDKYSQIVLACEGMQRSHDAGVLARFADYVNRGGRVFATHFRYSWLYMNGPFASTAEWQVNQPVPFNLTGNIDISTPKGADFGTWLALVGALSNANPPQIAILDPRRDLNTLSPNGSAQRWIYTDAPASVQHFTVDTPVLSPPDRVCGRVVYSDFHVLNMTGIDLTFPRECFGLVLTPQERVLEFMLLDLASCTGTTTPPSVPPPPPPPAR